MKKILKKGNDMRITFTCPYCDCVFEATPNGKSLSDSYYITNGPEESEISKKAVTACPTCGYLCKEDISIRIQGPTIRAEACSGSKIDISK